MGRSPSPYSYERRRSRSPYEGGYRDSSYRRSRSPRARDRERYRERVIPTTRKREESDEFSEILKVYQESTGALDPEKEREGERYSSRRYRDEASRSPERKLDHNADSGRDRSRLSSRRERPRSSSRDRRQRSRDRDSRRDRHRDRSKDRHYHEESYERDSRRGRGREEDSSHDSRRNRSRERRRRHGSRSPAKNRSKSPKKNAVDNKKVSQAIALNGDEASTEEQMKLMMGFGGFDSTKGKQVTGANVGGANIKKQRQYRQYMNRRGGFNRPLDNK